MKILMLIPFYYLWDSGSNVQHHYEALKELGYDVTVKSKKEKYNVKDYNLILAMGSGAIFNDDEIEYCYDNNISIISIGLSDPNLFNEKHFLQSDVYLTNDLNLSKSLEYHCIPKVYYHQTTCDKNYHKNLNLPKEYDILTYGIGNHRFVTNRNEIVNKLRSSDLKIRVLGRGWDEHEDTHDFIDGGQLVKEINKAHIVLDIINEKTSWPHRVFEASACGTPVLTCYREDTTKLLTPNEEVLLYTTFADMKEKLKMWLREPEGLKLMGWKAQQRCYKDHDISVRIKQLDKIIKELI